MKDNDAWLMGYEYDPDGPHRGPIQILRRSLNLMQITMDADFVLQQGSKKMKLLESNFKDIEIFIQDCFMDHAKSNH